MASAIIQDGGTSTLSWPITKWNENSSTKYKDGKIVCIYQCTPQKQEEKQMKHKSHLFYTSYWYTSNKRWHQMNLTWEVHGDTNWQHAASFPLEEPNNFENQKKKNRELWFRPLWKEWSQWIIQWLFFDGGKTSQRRKCPQWYWMIVLKTCQALNSRRNRQEHQARNLWKTQKLARWKMSMR